MCDHGFIGACAVCDGSGQQPEVDEVNTKCVMAGCRRPASDTGVYCPHHEDAFITADEFYGDEA